MNSKEFLEWDSNFFNLKIDKIILDSDFTPSTAQNLLDDCSADACYIFTPEPLNTQQQQCLTAAGAVKYDRKTVYAKKIVPVSPPAGIKIAEQLTGEIYELATAAGIYSRFNLDPRFRPQFSRLYHLWLERDFNSPTSKVFTYEDDGRVVGLVTLSCNADQGNIGLLATRKSFRGQGIGTMLLQACDSYLLSHGVKLATVTTQGENIPACRLYEKYGYQAIKQTGVWHWWRRSGS